jgi:hypothetical protein
VGYRLANRCVKWPRSICTVLSSSGQKGQGQPRNAFLSNSSITFTLSKFCCSTSPFPSRPESHPLLQEATTRELILPLPGSRPPQYYFRFLGVALLSTTTLQFPKHLPQLTSCLAPPSSSLSRGGSHLPHLFLLLPSARSCLSRPKSHLSDYKSYLLPYARSRPPCQVAASYLQRRHHTATKLSNYYLSGSNMMGSTKYDGRHGKFGSLIHVRDRVKILPVLNLAVFWADARDRPKTKLIKDREGITPPVSKNSPSLVALRPSRGDLRLLTIWVKAAGNRPQIVSEPN